jgi:hypothetical protein
VDIWERNILDSQIKVVSEPKIGGLHRLSQALHDVRTENVIPIFGASRMDTCLLREFSSRGNDEPLLIREFEPKPDK